MAVKRNQVARHVRVVLNDQFEEKCIGDGYLKEEPELYIDEERIMNDSHGGDYVHLSSEHISPDHPAYDKDRITGVNSGRAYLNQIDLKYPVREL